ncbi:FAM98A [Cordylochernes scorpioides]|uniref:FAM98A n=1 Tax=Cordylochernes scorpioides TaxID=51811 RepID=A0ABY6LAT6_9ARAC|nr:FAM98A [Cordylochernes scorpioides]
MTFDTLNYLTEVGYDNIISNQNDLNAALADGAKSIVFTKLVADISKELQQLCKLESSVNVIEDIGDSSNFVLELSSFLKELNCPYKVLMEGPVSQRLVNLESRQILLNFLLSEIQAARMIAVDRPEKAIQLEIKESPTALEMKQMLVALKFGKPPNSITSQQLFGAVVEKLKNILNSAPSGHLSKPLFTGVLTLKQWDTLSKIQKQIHEQYKLRKEMLITRVFEEKKKYLVAEPAVDISDVLCAREDLAIIEKTSSVQLRKTTQCEINKILIGAVPDRGGRPEEQQPPPPEMPSWQKQRSDGPSGGGNRIQRGGMSGQSNQPRRDIGDHGKGQAPYMHGPVYNPQPMHHYQQQPMAYQQDYNAAMPLYAQPGYSPYAPQPAYQQYDKPRGRGGGGNRRGRGGSYNNHGQNHY